MKPGATTFAASNLLGERVFFQDITDGTQRINLFANSDTGNDLSGNGTSDFPYASIGRCFEDVAQGTSNLAQFFVYCTGVAPFVVPDGWVMPVSLNNAKITQQASPGLETFGVQGFGGLNLIGVGTLVKTITGAQITAQTPRLDSELIDIDVSIVLVPNAYARLYCKDANGDIFVISDNDANTLNVVSANALAAPIQIFSRPTIQPTTPGVFQPTISIRGQTTEVVIAGFDIEGGGAIFPSLAVVGGAAVDVYGCRLKNGVWVGLDVSSAQNDGSFNGIANTFEGVCYVQGGSFQNSSGYFDNVDFSQVGGDAQVSVIQAQISDGSPPFFAFGLDSQSPVSLKIQNAEINKNTGVQAFGPCYLTLTNVSCIDSDGDGVLVSGNAYAKLNTVGGTGNALVGLRVQDGAHVFCERLPTVTGAGGDLIVGANAVQAWVVFDVANNEVDLLVQLARAWKEP